jgi:hypothetical protein
VTQFVGIADIVDRSDPVVVDGHAEAMIEFTVYIEQSAHGSIDYRRFDVDVAAGVFVCQANEKARESCAPAKRR